MILHQHAVEEGGHVRWSFERSVAVECWCGPRNIVDLPFARRSSWVCQRNGLLVDAASHAIDVGLVLIGIEDLQFISTIFSASGGEKHPTVAARLAAPGNVLRNFPFDVKLIITKTAFSFDVACRFVHCDYAARNRPLGG